MRKMWAKPGHREAMSKAHTGHRKSVKTKKILSIQMKKRWEDPKFRTRMLPKIARNRRKAGVSVKRATKLELRAKKLLLPLSFKHRVRLTQRGHIFDFGNHITKILVEVDGCYYHNHTCLSPTRKAASKSWRKRLLLSHKIRRQIAMDKEYRLVVLRECKEQKWPVIIEDFQERISSDGDAGKAKGKPARADKRSSVRP